VREDIEELLMLPRIAVVGSRDFPALERVDSCVRSISRINPNAILVSGGARGVDTAVLRACAHYGVSLVEYKPPKARYTSRGEAAAALLARNTVIVRDAGAVIAFWDLKSTGTLDVINKALSAGLPLVVLGPTGKIHQTANLPTAATTGAQR
jgi:hypothetical protein